MEAAGLPQPEFIVEAFMLYATIRNKIGVNQQVNQQDKPQVSMDEKIISFCASPKTRNEIAVHCGYKDVRSFAARYLKPMLESGRICMTIPDKPNSRNQKNVLTGKIE